MSYKVLFIDEESIQHDRADASKCVRLQKF